MALTTSRHIQRAIPRTHYAVFGALFALLLLGVSPSAATEYLTKASQMDELCALSAPVSDTVAYSQPYGSIQSKATEATRLYRTQRQEHLAQLYSVDVSSEHFSIARYDPVTTLLTLVPQTSFTLFAGTYALVFQQPPLLVFEVSPEEAEEIQSLFKSKNIYLKVEFGLEALSDPNKAFCVKSSKSPTTLQSIWISASLVGKSSAYPKPRVFTHHQNRATTPIKQAFSDPQNPARPKRPRVQVAHIRGLGVELLTNETKELIQDTESLVFSCFTKSLCDSGPHKGALVVETFFDPKGSLRDVNIVVDATGSSKLSTCIAARLEALAPFAKAADKGVRMSIYLDRW